MLRRSVRGEAWEGEDTTQEWITEPEAFMPALKSLGLHKHQDEDDVEEDVLISGGERGGPEPRLKDGNGGRGAKRGA